MTTRLAVMTTANALLGAVAAVVLAACAATNAPTSGRTEPANYLEVSERLVTSGQPSADRIAALDPFEYRLVINLAPDDGDIGFPDEAALLAGKGIVYVAIPVEIQQPDYRDFVLFSSILNSVGNSRAWVHCRFNYRASIFTFLYRVIHEGADPDAAYDKVTQVWVPTPHWLSFTHETLARHNIYLDF